MVVSRASVTQHPPLHHPKKSRFGIFWMGWNPNPTPGQGPGFIIFFLPPPPPYLPPPYLPPTSCFSLPSSFPAHNFFFFLWNLSILLSLVFLVFLLCSYFYFMFCVALFNVFVISLFFFFLFFKIFSILGLCMWHGSFLSYLRCLWSLYSFFGLVFSFVFVCVCLELCVCGAVEEEDKSNQKGRERRRGRATWGATRRGESLAVQTL